MKLRQMLWAGAAAAAIAGLAGCTSAPNAPMATVASVDLARYAGTWYEAASLPNRFQAQCVADTQARYRAQGDDIEVTNRCRKADGAFDEVTGVAKIVAGSGNAKLRVSFFRPFYGDYWVLALAPSNSPGNPPDYGWALVGEPSRRFGWVLSRSPQMAAADLEAALAQAESLGYARSAFKLTPQTSSTGR